MAPTQRRQSRRCGDRLHIRCAPMQLPIGVAHEFEGVVDILDEKAYYFEGKYGENLRAENVPDFLSKEVHSQRQELFTLLAEVDPELEDIFLNDKIPSSEQLRAAVRRTCVNRTFVPVFVGSAYKNKGVQQLLDAVEMFLPNPRERVNSAYTIKDVADDEGSSQRVRGERVELANDDEKPLVALAFKLEETKSTGLSNHVRVYQGKIRKGDSLRNVRTGQNFSVHKLVRMHSNHTENVDEVRCGEICAVLGELGLSSGDTMVKNVPPSSPMWAGNIVLENMFVPPPVMSFTIKPKRSVDKHEMETRLKAFMREDPTLCVSNNAETGELITEGMGELHLEIYFERLRREYGIDTIVGRPTVNYRETIQEKMVFDYTHKRQTGGQGQFAHVKGVIEPMEIDLKSDVGVKNRIVLRCPNSEIRENLQKSFLKQFEMRILGKGPMMRAPLWGFRLVLEGGSTHDVDSTDIAFRACAQNLFDEYFPKCNPTLLEPWMSVEISTPGDTFTEVMSEFQRRGGTVADTTVSPAEAILNGEASLDSMFGFITRLRSLTKGVGTFSMEFLEYRPMNVHTAQEIIDRRNKELDRETPFRL